MISIAMIRGRLASYMARLEDADGAAALPTRAAVALILRDGASGLEALFIERTHHPEDPWSGHLAFPGGRIEPSDASPRAAAERETREEVSLEFLDAEFLGQLDDVRGITVGVHVSAYVYYLRAHRPLVLSAEVAHAFWVPLGELIDPQRRATQTYRSRDREVALPAVDLLGPGRPLLWGLTFRFVENFAQIVGLPGASDPGPLPSDAARSRRESAR